MLPNAADKVKLTAVAAVTVTPTELLVKVPSVALTDAFSALYKAINPPEVDTPLVNVIAVIVPKLSTAEVLSVTVG